MDSRIVVACISPTVVHPSIGESLRSRYLWSGLTAVADVHLLQFACAGAVDAADVPNLRSQKTVIAARRSGWWPGPVVGGSAVRRAVKSWLQRVQPDVVVLSSATTAAILPRNQPWPVVIDLCDDDVSARCRLLKVASFREKAIHTYRNVLHLALEVRSVCPAWTACAVSPAEASSLQRRLGIDVHIIPLGVDLAEFKDVENVFRKPLIGFLGDLSVAHNIQAGRELVGLIHPLVMRKGISCAVRIGGRHRSATFEELCVTAPYLELVSPVLDRARFLAEFTAVVLPYRVGSGVKSKVLESWAAGTPVLGYHETFQGLPLPAGYAPAPTSESLAEQVAAVFGNQEPRQTFRHHITKNGLTWGSAQEKFNNLVLGAR